MNQIKEVWILEYTKRGDENQTYVSQVYASQEDAFYYHPVDWQPSSIKEPPEQYQYRRDGRVIAYLSRREVKRR